MKITEVYENKKLTIECPESFNVLNFEKIDGFPQ